MCVNLYTNHRKHRIQRRVPRVGPCVARLERNGDILELVVGAFGEVSSDLDRVISAMAESRVLYLARESGRLVTDGWRSVILGQYRRYFSTLFVKAVAACLTAKCTRLTIITSGLMVVSFAFFLAKI